MVFELVHLPFAQPVWIVFKDDEQFRIAYIETDAERKIHIAVNLNFRYREVRDVVDVLKHVEVGKVEGGFEEWLGPARSLHFSEWIATKRREALAPYRQPPGPDPSTYCP